MAAAEARITVVKDLPEAERLWQLLSPQTTIYDSWEFRYCFYKYFNFELFFYVAYDDATPVALLPLQYNSDTGWLEFFGGDNYMEDNRVFVKPGYESIIPKIYASVDRPAKLEFIIGGKLNTSPFSSVSTGYLLNSLNMGPYSLPFGCCAIICKRLSFLSDSRGTKLTDSGSTAL